MAKLESDYSLPYDEYVVEFRKKYPRAQPMSKYNYKIAQKKAMQANIDDTKAEKNNHPITLDSEAEDVYAYANANKNGTTEEYEKALNRAAMARDAIEATNDDTTDSVATPKEGSMVVNGVDVSLPYDEYVVEFRKKYPRAQPMSKYNYEIAQKKAMQTPEVQEEMVKGEKKADKTVLDSTNREAASSVTEVTTPKKDDPPPVINSKNQYNKAMMSIWDAYRAGEISKETAGYFTIDAIATLAKNLGRSIGNVGAQFSGGTIDNGHDESKWGQRQNALLNEEIGMETENLGGAAGRQAESENIANLEAQIRAMYEPQRLDLEIKDLENEVKKSGIDVTKAENSQALVEHIKQTPDYKNSPLKKFFVGILSQIGVGGAVTTGASALGKIALLKGK